MQLLRDETYHLSSTGAPLRVKASGAEVEIGRIEDVVAASRITLAAAALTIALAAGKYPQGRGKGTLLVEAGAEGGGEERKAWESVGVSNKTKERIQEKLSRKGRLS